MRTWFVLLIVAAGAVWIMTDSAPRELVGAAADRQVAQLFGEEPPSIGARVSSWGRMLQESAQDPSAPLEDRLGATELYVLHAISRGSGPWLDDGFAEATRLALETAYSCPNEPAFAAIALDALRAHRDMLGKEGSLGYGARAMARELIAWGRRHDPDNGLFLIFAAEVALEEDRDREARDLIVSASLCPLVDAYRADRFDACEFALARHGAPRLEAHEYLFRDHEGASDIGIGSLLENLSEGVARRLNDADDVERLRVWVALSRVGVAVARSSIWAADARSALEAEVTFSKRARLGVPDLLRPDRQAASLVARFDLAGLVGGHREIDAARGFRREFVTSTRYRPSLLALPKTAYHVAFMTAGHGLAIVWALVALAIGGLLFTLALPFSRFPEQAAPARPRRRKRVTAELPTSDGSIRSGRAKTPPKPPARPAGSRVTARVSAPAGLFIAATAAPALLLLYLGARGMGPFAGPDVVAAIRSPDAWLVCLPAVALMVFAVPCLGDARLRAPGVLLRELGRLSLLVAGVCLILFAWTSDRVLTKQEELLRTRAELRVDHRMPGP